MEQLTLITSQVTRIQSCQVRFPTDTRHREGSSFLVSNPVPCSRDTHVAAEAHPCSLLNSSGRLAACSSSAQVPGLHILRVIIMTSKSLTSSIAPSANWLSLLAKVRQSVSFSASLSSAAYSPAETRQTKQRWQITSSEEAKDCP